MKAAAGDGIPVAVIIPALNEEQSLPLVLESLSECFGAGIDSTASGRSVRLSEVVVVDNGSRDSTPEVARYRGATVLEEPRRGYGSACLRGIAYLAERPPSIVAFLDADFSDDPSQLRRIVMPIAEDEADFVLGSRIAGEPEPGALLPQARYGNVLGVGLIRWLYGHRYTDLGPFRALSWPSLLRLGMCDPAFGWTAEMQVKAVLAGLRIKEVPVSYRVRVGSSKITGTVSGTVRAGAKIIWTILRLRFRGGPWVNRDRGRS